MTTCFPKLCCVLLLLLLPAAESILGFNNTAEIKCIESERQALLNFKHDLVDAHYMLSTWRDDEKSKDCCKWKGIQCDHQTGRVGNLPYLQTLRLPGDFDVKPKDAHWLSNLSSLTHLAIDGLHNPDWLHMIHYPKLGELRLVDCSVSDTHIQSLFYSRSNFSNSLTILDLSSNMLTSSTFQLLSNFPSLVILDLSYNKMTSSVFQGIFNFSSKLQNLYLRNCSLRDDSFLMSAISITNSSSCLVSLDLSFNLLKSSSIFYWLFNSTTNLRTLELHHNMLEGPIPNGFGKSLSLSDNQITGILPMSIGSLSELEGLYLDGNCLEGDVTESHLSKFSKLRFLSLSDNSLSLKIVPNWVPPFQIIILELRSCKLGPSFPSWLQTQRSLLHLDISENRLNGSVPKWFWNNLRDVRYLYVSE
ncbi:receptor-like protein EIX1 [Vigna angularis]|uniref:receptor-like protein EIX1 n=1 Tax=Phaseolus angularis TaxID=3914 RepID=UPI00080A6EB6|nr:receptor-like protein EIX1 [Vigna angularis]